MPILLTLSSHSSGTFSILSASMAIGRISFSANQWVISLICFCCSDNSKLIMWPSPLSLRQSAVHRIGQVNHVPVRKVPLVPAHPASIFLPENLVQNHVRQATVLLNLSRNEANDGHGAMLEVTTVPLQDRFHPF